MAESPFERPPSYDREVGQRAQALFAEYGRRGERPDGEALFDEVVAVLRCHPFLGRRRPGPQRLATLTAVGLELMPPTDWTFLGAEVASRPGRIDLTWQSPDSFLPAPGVVLFDEMKAGAMPGHLTTGEVTDQVARYLRFGVRTFGSRFAGVRLVALSLPASSVFYRPTADGVITQPLVETEFWFGPRPGEAV